MRKCVSLLLALVMALSLLPGAALAAEAEPAAGLEGQARTEDTPAAAEETSYVSSIAYGTARPGDAGIDVDWNAEKTRYDVILPDTNGFRGCLWIYGNDAADTGTVTATLYNSYNEGEGTVVNNSYKDKAINTTATSNKFINLMLFLRTLTPESGPKDFDIVVGKDWKAAENKFETVLQVVRVHHRVRVMLSGLDVTSNGEDVALGNGFNPLTTAYALTLKPGQDTVTVSATPETSLAADDKAGTVLTYTDSKGQSVSSTEGPENTFRVSDLPKNSSDEPYICVNVEYSDPSKEVASSTYTLVFTESPFPTVAAVGETTLEIAKGSSTPIEVRVENEDQAATYTYQWYFAEKWSWEDESQAEVCARGFLMPGETKASYQPDTTYATRPTYYWCDVTKTTKDNLSFTSHSPIFTVTVAPTYASPPVITKQPEDVTVSIGGQAIFHIEVSYKDYQSHGELQWYRVVPDGEDIPVDASTNVGQTQSAFYPETDKEGVFQYYCVTTSKLGDNSATTKSLTVTLRVESIPGADKLTGDGSKDSPYCINNIDDLKVLKEIVENGFTLEGRYIDLNADLTLPADWQPIGDYQTGYDKFTDYNGKYANPFSGIFNGNDHTITIADGGTGIFNFVRKAEIKNLKIYGKNIQGSAVVTGLLCDYGVTGKYDAYTTPWAVKIDHVTLVSGSHTTGSGFMSGTGSGANTVWITNSTIEEGCVIGAPEAPTGGSFIHSLNGYITNCTSKATVYGAGGLAGFKGQTMGACNIQNSSFEGVLVSDSYAGGIIGSGYGHEGYRKGNLSAPNSPVVTVNNCYVHADITGSEMVGGIIGGEPAVLQCWGNGEGSISNNVFVGKIHTTGQCDAGGIIGYMRSIDQYQALHNNYYVADCGANSGIGYIGTVLYAVESAKPDQAAMPDTTFQLDSKFGFTEQPKFEEYCKAVPRENLNDLVDTLNKATKSFGNWVASENGPVFDATEVVPYELSIRGDYKTEYVIGDELDLSGAVITVTLTDRTTKSLDWTELTVEGYDKNTRGVQTVTLGYGGAFCEITVTVLKPITNPDADKINVTFTLYGDTAHGENGGVHTLQKGGLTTWIPRKTYTVDLNATVWDLIKSALDANGITYSNPSGNYIESLTYRGVTLAEFTNGNLSGWMYTLNSHHSDLGINEQFLENGDVIIFHYTDDYTVEEGSELWTDSGAGNKEEEAPTLSPTVTPDASGEAKAEIDPNAMKDAVADAKQAGAGEIVIEPQVKGGADKVTVELPKASAGDIADAGLDLTVETDKGSVTLPPAALKDLGGQSGSSVSVSVEEKKDETGKATGETAIEVRAGNTAVDRLSGGIKASLPAADEGGVLVIVEPDGTETVVKKSVVENGHIEALLDGSCTVKVIDNSTEFTDVADSAWYAGAVDFASSHELFDGVGGGAFAPGGTMTRGMLATVLWRLENEEEVTVPDTFADVARGSWYEDGIVWANEHGIVTGYSSGSFGPDDNITREQLATMLWRYAGDLGMDVTAGGDLTAYTDSGSISGYAEEAMQWAVGTGLLTGKGRGVLDPGGNATRAEVATIMERLVGIIVK